MGTFRKDERGLFGRIDRYTVLTHGDEVCCAIVTGGDGSFVRERHVPGLGHFLARAKGLCIGHRQLPDGTERIEFVDWASDGDGYAFHLHEGQRSGWGRAPFPEEELAT